MNQSALPPLPSPGWTLLARGEQENDSITRCPAGHIHLDYGNFTLRFQRDEFLAFARMVTLAAAELEQPRLPRMMAVLKKTLTVGFSLN